MSLGVSCHGLVYIYRLEGYDVVALSGVDLEIQPGESVALVGPSGSGKSTLMSLLAGLLRPSAGKVTVGDHDLVKATDAELQVMRSKDVGVVLQGAARNLLPYLSVEQNVKFAQRGAVGEAKAALPPAREVLAAVGLSVRSKYRQRPPDLTPGERQRLALAVGLACRPGVLLADEPTSQLDSQARDELIAAFETIRGIGTTVIVVTHDPEVGLGMGRTVTIRDGRVGGEGHRGEDFAVVGRDGSVHLPAELLNRYPAGTLMSVRDQPDGTILLIPSHLVDGGVPGGRARGDRGGAFTDGVFADGALTSGDAAATSIIGNPEHQSAHVLPEPARPIPDPAGAGSTGSRPVGSSWPPLSTPPDDLPIAGRSPYARPTGNHRARDEDSQ